MRCGWDASRSADEAGATAGSDHGAMPSGSIALPTVSLAMDAFCYGPLLERLPREELTGSDRPQRWSDGGAPTVYLASDIGVALAEWGRHVPIEERRDDSCLWRVPVRLDRAVDLRDPSADLTRALAAAGRCPDFEDHAWPLDQEAARDLAAWLRYEVGVDGLVVPSVAFLDDRARGNVVVFVEPGRDVDARLGEPESVAAVRWLDPRPAAAALDTRLQVPTTPPFLRV